ncbi:putative DNA ligase [Gordonia effusa NBRC 100432]|uniref:Probable DNA ligase n=1 Tax=Gordonia effusa NBRC 100432 TaxID=1077974 RepID=H0R3Z1_9ACTN|nr:ATP-dependent DNA ligase [Gordonia effusa]GAB19792.1 putative DNA ligase [Gordonia effusa NBRC 100432]
MKLIRVVEASAAVSATSSRVAKRAAIAEILSAADESETAILVHWLSGELPQGRIGVGWRSLLAQREVGSADIASLTVADVDAHFTTLAGLSGSGSSSARVSLLGEIFGAATEPEQQFLVRLISGELRQGALAGVMADAIAAATNLDAPTVRRAVMLTGSLAQTAVLARSGGAEALGELRIEVGRPLSPMLASPAESMEAAYGDLGPDVVIDYKYDGARIQVHRDGDQVRIFTRTLNEVTERLADIVAVVREFDCKTVILDGETLMLDESGRPRPFQETMSRFGSSGVDAEQKVLRPYFFDCLHLDGVDLIDKPLAERLEMLERVAPHHRIPSVRPADAQDAQRINGAALEAGHEGVMVKALDGIYAAGRRGKTWQKVKPTHTIDLIVLAAEWGSGRRRGWLSNLHLGARDPNGGAPIMVGKTFKGLTDELLRWQTTEFLRYETSRDEYTVYLSPVLVVEIELDGVQGSSRYPGGVALRFARVVRYRPDKTAEQADTIDTVRELRK